MSVFCPFVCPSTFLFLDSNSKTLCPIKFKLDREIDKKKISLWQQNKEAFVGDYIETTVDDALSDVRTSVIEKHLDEDQGIPTAETHIEVMQIIYSSSQI